MAKLTLGSVKTTMGRVLGKSTSSSDLVSYINEAQERLIARGDWWGTIVRYRFCANEAKLTWPRWVGSVRRINVCHNNVPIANQWYEFVGNGPGTLHDTDDPGLVLEDMGEACIFNDISGTNKKIYVISDQPESGKYICIQGYDENNKWVKTTYNGSLVDGEYIAVTNTGTLSTTVFANVSSIIKDSTSGTVTISEYDTGAGTYTPIGQYEHDEERPIYRRSRIPGLANLGSCGCDSDVCASGDTSIQAMIKLRHVPVSSDNDWLIIGNIAALKDMVMSIVYAEKENPQMSEYYEKRAVRELESEVEDMNKGAFGPHMDNIDPYLFGAGSIEGVI